MAAWESWAGVAISQVEEGKALFEAGGVEQIVEGVEEALAITVGDGEHSFWCGFNPPTVSSRMTCKAMRKLVMGFSIRG